MASSQRPKGRDGDISTLDMLIQTLNVAKDACGIPPAQIVFGSAGVLLAMIRDKMANHRGYVDLGQTCGNVCEALHAGLKERQMGELNQPVLDAVGGLTTTVSEIQKKVTKRGKRNVAIRFVLARRDRNKIAAWKQDLVRFLQVFDTQLVINTHRITSPATTAHPSSERPETPTLSMEAACDIFYNAYGNSRRSSVINGLLERLEFHALSTTLLATTASHNGWDHAQLAEEWDTQRARVLQTDHNKSLVATIELSLASPTFCSLGPDARDLLGVVAFFPQGIDENNLDWLFPTISNRRDVFDKSCVLSLTHRSNGFVTMTAPIRDYLSPQDPQSSPLLCTTKDRYFSRLSVEVDPNKPGFQEAQWVASEDVNIEHLLDVFTSLDQDATDNWDACYHFMDHLYWHKPRETVLGPKIEALPDDHQSKPRCLFGLSRLFRQAWNHTEQKRLLIHTLELERRRGDDSRVAETLRLLSDANRLSYFLEEGIQQAKEAVDILQRINDPVGQAVCLNTLAWLLFDHHQLNAAEDAASRAIDLISGKSQEYHLCELHRVLGRIFQTKGEKGKAIHHFEAVLRIATPFDWHQLLFWTHSSLAKLFCDEREFDDASAHIGQAKSHAVDGGYNLGRSHKIQANIWYHQGRLKDAKSEVLHAFGIFEELGATKDIGDCRNLLYNFELESKASSPGAQAPR